MRALVETSMPQERGVGTYELGVQVFIFRVLYGVFPCREEGLGVITAVDGSDRSQSFLLTPLYFSLL